ncbi:MAG: pyridoxamine 5'-phosphate oxidase family protein [Chloroflexi bacterium]|nr:MAG: pyridoxamine 5'-phosphate oxidase family protein [Chloroflexota bacterium]
MPKKATANKTKPKKSTAKKTSPVTSAAKDVAAKAEPTQKNLDIYGAKPLLWSRAVKQLEAGPPGGTFWLATTKPDGRPHVAGVGALWVDGKIYFVSGARTRKSRNLTANPNCVFSVSLTGIDLVIEGIAMRVTDRPTLLRLAQRYAAQGWPASVSGQALTADYSAPSAGPAPWSLYVLKPTTAFGVASGDPHGATRWTFDQTR